MRLAVVSAEDCIRPRTNRGEDASIPEQYIGPFSQFEDKLV